MKKIILFIFLLLNFNLFSQTYVLDSSFGDSGIKQFNKNIHIINGLLVNNYYYFISVNTILKVNYDGQIVTNYGSNGLKLLEQTNETLTISNFLFYNNYFYIYGSVKNNTTNNTDIYISKIDENGNYDTTFGTSGILKLDFGLKESISRLLIEHSGDFYCIGSRSNQSVTNTSRLILFKIDINGSVNTTFNSNGFKEIPLNLYTTGVEIISENNQYMILGTTTEFDGTYNRTRMMIAEVDSNGNINTTFGVNGFKIIPLANSGIYYNTIKNAELLNNTLYINMNQGGAMVGDNNNNLLIYNLVSSQVESSVTHNQSFYDKVTNDGVFLTSYCYSCCSSSNPSNCDNTFELRKMNLDGTVNTNFHINGLYSYEFEYPQPIPNVTFGGDSRSYAIIIEPNGKILIAGFVYNQGSTPGFSAIRIVEGALGLNNIENNINSIYPNPFNDKIFFKSTSGIKNIEVYDVSGRKITNVPFKNDNNNATIDLSKISNKGIYLIKITAENNEVVIKKIVKR